ncbi:MAG: DUF885 domain-containing protein [Planctomycetota bacterium]
MRQFARPRRQPPPGARVRPRRWRAWPLLAIAAGLAGCAPESAGAATAQLAALVAQDWAARLAADPLFATSVGEHAQDGSLPDLLLATLTQAAEADRALLAALEALDPEQLSEVDRDTRALLAREVAGRVQNFEFGAHEIPLNSDSGFHTALLRWPQELPLGTPAERAAYVARIEAVPGYIAQNVVHMRAGLARGMTLPRVVATGLGEALAAETRAEVRSDPAQSVLYGPFRAPAQGSADAALAQRARAATQRAVEALAAFRAFLDDEYAPRCRESLGASQLPNGTEYYAFCVRWFTTFDTTPREVHERGLAEVARIRADMQRVIDEVTATGEFRGDFAAFLAFLRADPRFYARTPGELLAFASRRCKRIDGLLPRWFEALPRQPYGVEPVPDDIAPRYTGGRYVPAPIDSTRAGTYWVNTYDLASRPLYLLPALTLHEAVPGHHLQMALAQELRALPAFRRHAYVDAFGEGWALYGEWLGQEMGVYDGPYEEFGRLSYEMWRAARLVVDTGLHAFGWERERALEFLTSNTALSLHECHTEVDRYIAWPGQALAYKTGELELRRLRARAEEALGARFDVRAFHTVVLGAGTVTLDVLGQRVERWLAARP